MIKFSSVKQCVNRDRGYQRCGYQRKIETLLKFNEKERRTY